jgi:hypothetical protein
MLQRYHAQRAQPRAFQVGDLVLRRVQTKKRKDKLNPSWERPLLVVEVLQPRAYWFQEISGATFPNVWNIEQLKKFYP